MFRSITTSSTPRNLAWIRILLRPSLFPPAPAPQHQEQLAQGIHTRTYSNSHCLILLACWLCNLTANLGWRVGAAFVFRSKVGLGVLTACGHTLGGPCVQAAELLQARKTPWEAVERACRCKPVTILNKHPGL